MPDTMSIERRKVLNALGAKSDPDGGLQGNERRRLPRPRRLWPPIRDAILHAAAVQESRRTRRIHFETTGPEIWDDTAGQVDVLVSGVGTGGTITGVSRYIKHEKKHPLISIAVEPTASPVITQTIKGEELRPGPHKIQGLGAGFIPDTLDLSVVDRVELVTNEESIEMARRLAQEEGMLSGISCGAAVAAAVRVAKEPEMKGKNIVDGSSRCR